MLRPDEGPERVRSWVVLEVAEMLLKKEKKFDATAKNVS